VQGCAMAVECNALPSLIAIVESCVPVVESIMSAAAEADRLVPPGAPPPPPPDIDPHRVGT